MKQIYYTVYKTTNIVNNMIYIGAHVTKNINDSYIGSGKDIQKAIKEYGKENFTKEILHVFDNKEDMLSKEKELVNHDFIADNTNYNIILGGGFMTTDCITVKDKDGKPMMVHKTNSRYLNGELVGICKGFIPVKDKDNNTLHVSKDDPRYLSGELIHITKNKKTISVKDKNGNILSVKKTDPRYLSGELVHTSTNKVVVKDKEGNTFQVDSNDPRYLNSELVHNTTNKVVVKDKEGNTFQVDSNDPRWISGELVGINKNKKISDEVRKKMSISHLGKNKGRIGINNSKINKRVHKHELNSYLESGWIKGTVKL